MMLKGTGSRPCAAQSNKLTYYKIAMGMRFLFEERAYEASLNSSWRGGGVSFLWCGNIGQILHFTKGHFLVLLEQSFMGSWVTA